MVDDEPALVRLGTDMLEKLGYNAEGAHGALEALSMLRDRPEHYALVITDQTMPVMTGVELFQEIRTIQPILPVILITGCSARLTSERVRHIGLAHLLLKPLSLAQLGETLNDVLQNKRDIL
jgi:two-component system, cell cycle sensor histidine kinase and response regulator CckA